MKRWVWVLVVVVVIAAGGGVWWWFNVNAQEPQVPTTVAVSRGDVERTVLANGILQASRLVSVGAQVSGRIENMAVALGQDVEQGDLIAEIDSLDQENAVRAAEASLANMEAQKASQEAEVSQATSALQRSRDLLARELVSTSEFETAEATLKVAQAALDAINAQIEQARIEVESTKLDLSRTRITAPMSGTIVAVVVDEGQTVSATQSAPTIVKIADLDTMRIEAEISEADVINVEPGQEVYFTVLGDPDTQIDARLLEVEPAPSSIESDSDTDTSQSAIYYNGIFEVPNPDRRLRISMTAEVTIVLERAEDVLTLPSSVLGRAGPDGSFSVSVYDPATNTTHRQPVEVGLDDNVKAEIVSGLEEGDLVVASRAFAAAGSPARPGGGLFGGGGRGGR